MLYTFSFFVDEDENMWLHQKCGIFIFPLSDLFWIYKITISVWICKSCHFIHHLLFWSSLLADKSTSSTSLDLWDCSLLFFWFDVFWLTCLIPPIRSLAAFITLLHLPCQSGWLCKMLILILFMICSPNFVCLV